MPQFDTETQRVPKCNENNFEIIIIKAKSHFKRLIDKNETFLNTQYPTLLDIACVDQS